MKNAFFFLMKIDRTVILIVFALGFIASSIFDNRTEAIEAPFLFLIFVVYLLLEYLYEVVLTQMSGKNEALVYGKSIVGIVSFTLYFFMVLKDYSEDVNFDESFITLIVALIFFVLYISTLVNVTRMLCALELKKHIRVSSVLGTFLLVVYLFPIGFWFIHPRVQKLVSASKV